MELVGPPEFYDSTPLSKSGVVHKISHASSAGGVVADQYALRGKATREVVEVYACPTVSVDVIAMMRWEVERNDIT